MKKERRFFFLFFAIFFLVPILTHPSLKLTGFQGLANPYQIWATVCSVGSFCLIYMIASQALNLQVGFVGLLQLGAVAFVGIGGYTAALLLKVPDAAGQPALVSFFQSALPQLSGHWRWVLFFLDPNFLAYLAVIPAAILVSVALSLLIGIPTLRLSGDYFAIVTLGFAQIVQLVVKNEVWLTEGAFGVKNVPPVFSFCTGEGKIDFADKAAPVFFGLAVLALAVYLAVRIRGSYLGRAFTAMRDNELAAQSHGVNLTRYRILNFVIFSSLAALAGVVLVARNRLISPSDMNFWESVLYLCCIVLGGLGSVRGALIGGFILGTLGEILRRGVKYANQVEGVEIPAQIRYIVFGLLLVIVMRTMRNGLLPRAREAEALGKAGVQKHRSFVGKLFDMGGDGADS